MTAPETNPILEHVMALEQRLLDPVVRRDRKAVAELLDPDFYEFGRSGVVWLHDALLDALDEEDNATIVADGVVLLTYHSVRTLLLTKQRALRSSVWVRGSDGQWRMRFHQGTPAA